MGSNTPPQHKQWEVQCGIAKTESCGCFRISAQTQRTRVVRARDLCVVIKDNKDARLAHVKCLKCSKRTSCGPQQEMMAQTPAGRRAHLPVGLGLPYPRLALIQLLRATRET